MSATPLSGVGFDALESLSPEQTQFLKVLPKTELHAHLNGCVPLKVLRELAEEAGVPLPIVHKSLTEVHEFFGLFPAIYALTTTPNALRRMTRAVLEDFLDNPDDGGCTYLELRSTPKQTSEMTRKEYMCAVLDEVERYPKDRVAFIASIDRRMDEETATEIVDASIQLKREGRRIVALDLCGDILAGDVDMFVRVLRKGKEAGLEVTVHIAESAQNTPEETLKLLSIPPGRLGHATFLNEEAIAIVVREKIPVEICLSSNLVCNTVKSLEAHHIRQYLQAGHPIAICTDDTLPFRNSIMTEYALLLAKQPLGLGLSQGEVEAVAKLAKEARFPS